MPIGNIAAHKNIIMSTIIHSLSEDEFKELISSAVFDSLKGLNLSNSEITLIKVPEVLDLLQISRTTLHKYVEEGRINGHYLGTRKFFIREEIIEAVKSGEFKRVKS